MDYDYSLLKNGLTGAEIGAAADLALFIENDGGTYFTMTIPVINNQKKHNARGDWTPDLALKAFINLTAAGAKEYKKQIPWSVYIPDLTPAARRLAAGMLLDRWIDEIHDPEKI